MIRQLDVRRQQVLVEAIIVEISDIAAQQLGVQLFLSGLQRLEHPVRDHQLFQHHPQYRHHRRRDRGARAAAAPRPRSPPARDRRRPPRPAPATTLIEAAAAQLAGDQRRPRRLRGPQVGNAIFGAIINAVRSDNQSNILSTPSIMTLDNQEARILVGQEIPITTGEALSPNFDNAFRTVAAPECRHHARGPAADQRRRHDQARPARRR